MIYNIELYPGKGGQLVRSAGCSAQLMEVKERLLQTGKEMAAINEQNEILLNQALEMVEFDLTLLKSMRQAPETANYNKNACNTGDLLGSSGFDAKQ